jgi:hypothetical protein
MSSVMFVVLVADEPQVMVHFIVPLIAAVPAVFLLSIALRVAQLVFRACSADSAGGVSLGPPLF